MRMHGERGRQERAAWRCIGRASWRAALCGGVLLAAAGCGGDATGPAAQPLYWQLQLNHHAITLGRLAPYDTIQLTATPLDVTGAPMATTARPVFTVLNRDTSIAVDSTGFVRVHWANATNRLNIKVVASLALGDRRQSLTLTDTAQINVVNVTGTVPTLDSLVFQPVAGDSARRAVIDASGNPGTQTFASPVAWWGGTGIPNVLVQYKSSNPGVVAFVSATTSGPPQVNDSFPGVALLTAEATVYGKRMVDSLWYTVGYPLWLFARYGSSEAFVQDTTKLKYNPKLPNGTLTIGQGGVVLWANMMLYWPDDSLDVEFDDPTPVLSAPVTFTNEFGDQVAIPADAGGNIPSFPRAPFVFDGGYYYFEWSSVSTRARTFPQVGTYHWVSRHQGIDGRVIVVSNDSLKRPTLP